MKFQRIKNIREDMELTQQQVADKLKVSRGTYSMWETANDIKNAVEKVIAECKIRTPDLGGDASTIDITKAIVKELI